MSGSPPEFHHVLSAEELDRYARHIVLREIGGPGQQKLKAARVLVIGAGGLGSPALLYLAAAGVGTLGVVDDDEVSLSNLQRQVLHRTADVGLPKTESAAAAIHALNPHVTFEEHRTRIGPDNAADLIAGYDVVLDGSDNFGTRYTVSDAAFHARRPLVMGWLGTMDAALTTLRPYESSPSGQPNPTYRCLFPEPPPDGTIPACEQAGVLGALAGTVGALMAMEAIRAVVPFGEGLVGRLLMIDARSMRFETIAYGWDRTNPLTGEAATVTATS